jgi:thiamine-monophosphate kinase
MPTTLAEVGEFGLIARIMQWVSPGPTVAVGIGDDAAVWRSDKCWLVGTTDALVEDVDFRFAWSSWEDLGWKALAINLSDMAAMGGRPQVALVTLCLPQGCAVADIEAFYRGMGALARQFETTIVGGDISSSAQVMVNVTLIGSALSPEALLLRSQAQNGDLIAVTGVIGNAAAGLALLEAAPMELPPHLSRFVQAQRRPVPRVREGQTLVEAGVRCGIDVSDGLVADLEKLCQASGVSAELALDQVPVDPGLAEALGNNYRVRAITGGEDFELLFTAPESVMVRALEALQRAKLTCGTVIGRICAGAPGKVTVRGADGEMLGVSNRGFDHFRRGDTEQREAR